jgi:hypothetical protein
MVWNVLTSESLPLRVSGGGWTDKAPGTSSSTPRDDPRDDEGLGEAARGLTHPRHKMSIQLGDGGCRTRHTMFHPAVLDPHW